jgi:hypothetical protein
VSRAKRGEQLAVSRRHDQRTGGDTAADQRGGDTTSDVEVGAADQPTGPRVVVLRGGVPTAEQSAALAAALLTVEQETTSASLRLGGWQRAALLEGIGGPTVSQRADLERPGQR